MLALTVKKLQPALAGTAFGLAAMAGAPAVGQTYSIGITNANRDIGTIATGATGETVFSIATNGTITKTGLGTKVPSLTSTSVVTVTLACGNQNACNSTTIEGTITAGSVSGRAKSLRNFDIAGGTASISNEAGTGTTRTFRLGPIGKKSSKTFVIKMDFPIKGDDEATVGSGYGNDSSVADFSITLDPNAGNTTNTSGSVIATTYRALSITENSPLAFGRMVRPTSGTSTVTINAITGLRSVSPTLSVPFLGTPTPTRATYTVNGEGGRNITLSVPTSVVMSSGGSNITVTLTKTGSSTPTLTSTLGNAGSYSFGVGGSFTLTNSTATGAYSGTFPVSINYN